MSKEKDLKLEITDKWNKLNKLKERLVILLDHNVNSGVDPSEDDIFLLRELCGFIDRSSVTWMAKEPELSQDVTQTILTLDKTAEENE